MSPHASKNLLLIVARELASLVATPVFIVDAEGTLIFFNESAEEVLGLRYSEAGELSVEKWATMWAPQDSEGAALDASELPLVQALSSRRPIHRPFAITTGNGKKLEIEVTAFPLFARADHLVGGVAIFWVT
ncbi:MAG: PAS domain-containing protein [Actinomycetota bacterium]|nr:PAS domain-containing protein [Actinomycetota bacterium]